VTQNKQTKHIWIFWIIAVLITFIASYYQRTTGPTYSKEINYVSCDSTLVVELPRSGGTVDEKISLKGEVKAVLHYRVYPTNDKFTDVDFSRVDDGCEVTLPVQAPAGKLEYYITIDGKDYFMAEPLIIRFKGDISPAVLIPHIIFLFASMLFGAMVILLSFVKDKRYMNYTIWTIVCLLVGGFIFGPLVQFQAFGEPWTGFPNGRDLTDNKALVALIALLIAFFLQKRAKAVNTKKANRNSQVASIIAILILFIIFSIPHSLYGSELNPETGKIETGECPSKRTIEYSKRTVEIINNDTLKHY